jgi:hypothetical protein
MLGCITIKFSRALSRLLIVALSQMEDRVGVFTNSRMFVSSGGATILEIYEED